MTWPFKVPTNTPEVQGGEPAPEKSPAELIAESIGPLLKPITDAIAAQNERFDAIEQNTHREPPKPPVVQQGDPTSVLDDENLAFAQRLTPIMARQLELEARVVKNDIKSEYLSAGYAELWTKFESEINTILDATELVTSQGKPFRGDPQYIRNVVDMVFGRAARKSGMRFDGKTQGFFLETSGPGSLDSITPEADGMNDTQRKVMQRMGIPLDKAKETLKKLQFVH